MIKKTLQLIFITGIYAWSAGAQKLSPEQYIERYKSIAIREMKRMGVPAAISLAQGILETESGNSDLVKKSNNHFGIKCKSSWTARGVNHDDDARGECFRTYKSAEESYRDHSNFLRGSDRYSSLFNLSPTDYKAWAYGLKKAGYATNPNYPNILIKHIERYNLQQYSIAGAAHVPRFENNKYKDDKVVFDNNGAIDADQQQGNIVVASPIKEAKTEESGSFAGAREKINFINGSKCINAKKGTSLLVIATRYNINLQRLLEINELEEDGILEEDQLIFLQRKSKTGDRDFVVVQKNETLYDVAQENGIQLESLLVYNQLNEDGEVSPGTKLYLRPVAESSQAKIFLESAAAVKDTLYEVQPKDALYSVAKKYRITVQQLKEWNNLTSDELKIGQQLIVGK